MNERRYREAERRLWEQWDVDPAERRVSLARSGVQMRLLEVGDGPAVVFVHGAPNAGSTWAPLAARMTDFRCYVIDRPGTGLSREAVTVDAATLPGFADSFLDEVLVALEVDRAHVVASSFGGYLSLRSAAAHPDRIRRMVQMSCPAFVPGMHTPAFMRLLVTPGVRHVMAALPPNRRSAAMTFRQMGHGPTLQAGTLPDAFVDLMLSMQRDTATLGNELEMLAGLGGPIGGFDDALELDADLLASIEAPTFFLWGGRDPFGGTDVAQRLVELIPDAALDTIDDGGHLPWLDDFDRAADATRSFLSAG